MNTRIRIARFADSDAAHVEKSLEALAKVSSVRVEPEENVAIVEHDGAESGDMIAALRRLGYVADVET